MKKVLLGTSALVAAGVISSAAHASEPVKLEVGGYMDWWVAAGFQEDAYIDAAGTQYNDVDVFGNGEVHFKGSTTLDNGVKVGVQVELEGGNRSEGDPVDESYVTIDSQYGRVVLGSDDNVAYSMHVSAPDVGRLGVDETYLNEIIVNPATTRLATTAIDTDGDTHKLTYITPTFSGLTAGVTYVPGASGDLTGEDTLIAKPSADGSLQDGYVFGLTYSAEYAGTGITVSGGYAQFDLGEATPATLVAADKQEEYSVGVNVAMDAFTFGGAYRDVDNNGTDSKAWNLGVAYEQGPYGASIAYMNSKVETTTEDETSMVLVSGRYAMGAGVDAFASVGYMDYEDGASAAAANNNKGYAFVTGVALTF